MALPDSNQADSSPVGYNPTGSPERAGDFIGDGRERVPVVELTDRTEISPEMEKWVEPIESGTTPPPSVVDEKTGEALIESSIPAKVEIKLPLGETAMQAKGEHNIFDSFTWLLERCARLLKLTVGKFIYRYAS